MKSDENYFFIHNVYAHFFDDTLNYFANYLYPRFHHQVVGTYDKAVEYINKKVQYNNEHDMPNLPAIILNPSGDFHIADANSGAYQLWRFPNLSKGNPGLKLRIYDPIYQDNHVVIHPMFTRMKGEIELILLLNSFYEYCDMKMFLYQIFGGLNRPIYPSIFRTFLIIPDEMLNMEYNNPITGVNYTLDWESAGAYQSLIRTTNRTETVVPVNIKPRYTMVGISDASMKYGGIDKLADWRLSVSLEYEIEMPWFVHMKTDYAINVVDVNFGVDTYMGNADALIDNVDGYDTFRSISDPGLENGIHGKPLPKEEMIKNKINEREEWEKDGFYIYTFTQEDIDNLLVNNITDGFEIPNKLDDANKIFIISKYGNLNMILDYVTTDINTKDTLIQFIINKERPEIIWEKDDIVEIYSFTKIA